MFGHTAFAAAAAALMITACDRKSDNPTAPIVATPTNPGRALDTLRGVVTSVVNDDSTTSVKLTTAAGLVFTLIGPNAGAVPTDDALEIWVQGKLTADQLYVETYALRGGEPTCEPWICRPTASRRSTR